MEKSKIKQTMPLKMKMESTCFHSVVCFGAFVADTSIVVDIGVVDIGVVVVWVGQLM